MQVDKHPGPVISDLEKCIVALDQAAAKGSCHNHGTCHSYHDLDIMICRALGYEARPYGRSALHRIRKPGQPAFWTPPRLTSCLDDAVEWLLPRGCAVIPRSPIKVCALGLARLVDKLEGGRVCRICGCTDHAACPGGCSWHERDLCSACADGVLR
ncbi:hypothetical protein FHP25_24810 [Vineibacter terrae]|uniref:Uncharacterized protein n=1 Tax=Vineibacter terrae TaxID=2586908 RepID=A0A5C8PFD9_9HYPH|nr:hypothetical protein [Vineibacter terrae]TXL72519.1 hypothetical protein FHP25_24810 [Vineibacter terrae]